MALDPSPIPGLDDVDWDMIRRGDMLGHRLGSKVADVLVSLLSRIEEVERERDEAAATAKFNAEQWVRVVAGRGPKLEAAESQRDILRTALIYHERLLLINSVRKAAEEAAPLSLEAADTSAESARNAIKGSA